jgi:hypothetical protein
MISPNPEKKIDPLVVGGGSLPQDTGSSMLPALKSDAVSACVTVLRRRRREIMTQK